MYLLIFALYSAKIFFIIFRKEILLYEIQEGIETMINITGHTGLTGLLGSPVAHSVSPLMHNEAFRYLGLDYVYLCFDVTEETLPQAVEGLKACGSRALT